MHKGNVTLGHPPSGSSKVAKNIHPTLGFCDEGVDMMALGMIAIRDDAQEPMMTRLGERARPYVETRAAHVLSGQGNGNTRAQEELVDTIERTLQSSLNGGSGYPNRPYVNINRIDGEVDLRGRSCGDAHRGKAEEQRARFGRQRSGSAEDSIRGIFKWNPLVFTEARTPWRSFRILMPYVSHSDTDTIEIHSGTDSIQRIPVRTP